MYLPAHFEESRPEVLQRLLREHPLGLLVTQQHDARLEANAIPFLLDASVGTNGILRGHLARANPQWQHLKDGARALVVFQGPDAYVSPGWYAAKKEHGKVVPTWNYVMVQVRGPVRVFDDPQWLHDQITALTASHEEHRAEPWQVTDAPERYIEMQKRAIVGIEITIDDIRGKWKVSQNRSAADSNGVAAGLSDDGNADMEDLVRRYAKSD